MRKLSRKSLIILVLVLAAAGAAVWFSRSGNKRITPASAPKAALAVNVIHPQYHDWPISLVANGNIAAWQEAVIGSETGGIRLASVDVNVGAVVKRGQVLAQFATGTLQADIDQQQANIAEAEANLSDAQANAVRARALQGSGALSTQQIDQYQTTARTAQARLDAARAQLKIQQLRFRQARIVAPDDGVISSRSATLGAVVPTGQELFRLIRQNRLEWRAQVTATELARVRPGQRVSVVTASGARVAGKVRMLAPTVDTATRTALVYVDLPTGSAARAGMFATGSFELGKAQALTLPQSAVVMRDGFNYVYRVSADNHALQTKVRVGRRIGDRVEITAGIQPEARVVAAGGGFLADGDLLRVVPVTDNAQ